MNILLKRSAICISGCGGRLDFFRCAVDNTMGQNTMAFLMFSCLRGVGSSRRSLAACAFDACIPRWCMALLLRLALLPALMSSEPHACFLRSHTGAAEYSRPGQTLLPASGTETP